MGSQVRRVEGPQSEGCWLLGVGSGGRASESWVSKAAPLSPAPGWEERRGVRGQPGELRWYGDIGLPMLRA